MNTQLHRTILIVEDSPEDRETYRRYLLRDHDYDYTIIEASLGKEGLNLWRQHEPDVVLLDYQLPDMDGLEFLVSLQTQQPQTPMSIVMMTGVGSEAIAVQAIKGGVQDYLVKEQITSEGLKLALDATIKTVQIQTQLQERIDRERVIAQISQKVSRSLDLDEILHTTVTEVRQFLQTDRVIVFQVDPDDNDNGRVVAESVGADWRSILSEQIYDPCFVESYVDPQLQGRVSVKADIYDGSINPCYVKLLEGLQVRANLVAPILHDNHFWGVLIAHHCAAPRQWRSLEIDLLQQLSIQVSVAIRQAELYQQVKNELAERKRAEEVLRQSEEFRKQVLESSRDCIKVLDLDAQILYINAGGLCLLEIDDLTPYLNTNWVNFWQDESRQKVEAAIAVAKSKETSRFLGFCLTAKGTPKWWDVIVTPMLDQEGQVNQLLATSRDITDRVQLQHDRELILQHKQAALAESERINHIKDEFLTVLSHELRSPLSPILGWTKLLQTRRLDETKTIAALETIERNVKTQCRLIDDLLDMARVLRGKLSLNAAPVNLLGLIKSAIDTVQTAAIAKSIQINPVLWDIGQVSGDNVRLQQIVWNLLTNAVKFTPSGGRIDIRLEQIDNQAQITIIDTGKGISPDFLPHIFESFRQEDASVTRKHGGLGLGMAIVYQLVEAHGGTVTADSPGEGKGATFTVRLPLLNVNSKENQSSPSPEQNLDLTGIRVLIIDDDPDSRELVSMVIAQAGAEAITVASAAEFLNVLESFQPDVVVSDIGMPEVDGYMLLRQVRSLSPDQGGQVPAIALTAYAGEIDQQQAIAAGFQKHIAKPIEPDQLVVAIVSLLSRQALS
ncbi:response regulator [Dolichospermum sp. ST_sed1]|nr:response regulator [Dolichospermum sp. ST_sed1]MDD1427336.1 response regulator [Dolichospermum sp. ST_sed9]MDD1433779.1 response regulator [Dolichospermum sp. ST_sed6]MDD1442709.1 response regulator [Dolichospermum sp. ST_sed3]MDD1448718.1 response regulator [Dolichospermum sp. ST_sed8]MDD1455363.1 response regulator [Dolichospermum sp. ST_sed7]MDD1462455.1 response regulator [Dolichospermum sp. ST_sed2]MDD1464089.1 response regulator [Dolichospermum sp. ST_sed5]MDD1470343.1 response reg